MVIYSTHYKAIRKYEVYCMNYPLSNVCLRFYFRDRSPIVWADLNLAV